VYLFPTRAQWLAEAANRGEGSLGDLERSAIQRLRDQFLGSACATDADVMDAVGLADALLGHGVNVVHERS